MHPVVYFSKKLLKKAFFQRLGIEEYHTHNYVIVTDRHFASVCPFCIIPQLSPGGAGCRMPSLTKYWAF